MTTTDETRWLRGIVPLEIEERLHHWMATELVPDRGVAGADRLMRALGLAVRSSRAMGFEDAVQVATTWLLCKPYTVYRWLTIEDRTDAYVIGALRHKIFDHARADHGTRTRADGKREVAFDREVPLTSVAGVGEPHEDALARYWIPQRPRGDDDWVIKSRWLKQLPENETELLLDFHVVNVDINTLAFRHGITAAAMYKRVERIGQKVRDLRHKECSPEMSNLAA